MVPWLLVEGIHYYPFNPILQVQKKNLKSIKAGTVSTLFNTMGIRAAVSIFPSVGSRRIGRMRDGTGLGHTFKNKTLNNTKA